MNKIINKDMKDYFTIIHYLFFLPVFQFPSNALFMGFSAEASSWNYLFSGFSGGTFSRKSHE